MKNSKNLAALLLASGLSFGAGQVLKAEEIRIPVGSQAQSDVKTPKKGISKAQVKKRFGEPSSISVPVGKPPISHWKYGSFTVYFEYNHVIHSVVHRN